MQTYKVATVNISRISSAVKLQCLKDYLYAADIDVAMLQEVVTTKVADITGYDAIINIGNEGGTAVLFKEGIPCSVRALLETGRGITVQLHDLLLINVYAPSGSNERRNRSNFYRQGIVDLLMNVRTAAILAGDFNCVLRREDQTPNFNLCPELQVLVHDLDLIDTWISLKPHIIGYTYVSSTSASRIDRIYVTKQFMHNVDDCEIWPTNFSDHCAYHVSLRYIRQPTFRGRGIWQLNVSLLPDAELKQQIRQTWHRCLQSKTKYRERITWWSEYAKPLLRKCIIQFAKEQAYWRKQTTEYYFSCLRDLYKRPDDLPANIIKLKRFKSKITALVRQRLNGVRTRARGTDDLTHENPSLYHVIRETRRGKRKIITLLRDDEGEEYTTQTAIKQHVVNYYRELYAETAKDGSDDDELLAHVTRGISEEDNVSLTEHITPDEIKTIISTAPRNKSAGPDGLPVEFYVNLWDVIGNELTEMYNELLTTQALPKQFTEGLIVLIPKKPNSKRIQDFRPLTLLNADFKILTRILNSRMKSLLKNVIGTYQTSAIHGRSMLDTLCEYRDIINLTWISKSSLSLVFIDFDKAFDRVNHDFLIRTMQKMGFNNNFVNVIRKCISGTSSRIKINGQLTEAIPVRQSVRQGCPLSMSLYAIAVEPLLSTLHHKLRGLNIFNIKTVCHAYADDVSVIVNSNSELQEVQSVVSLYSRCSGAKLNLHKSKIMHLSPNNGAIGAHWLEVTEERLQLGLHLRANPTLMATINWERKLHAIRILLQEHNARSLDRFQKAQFINTYVLSKIYHVAAVLPIPHMTAQKILAAACWFVWKQNIFKVPFNTTTLQRHNGGLGIKDVKSRCDAMFLARASRIVHSPKNCITKLLFASLDPGDSKAPLNVAHIDASLDYVRKYYVEWSYIQLSAQHISTRIIYDHITRHHLPNPIETKYPEKNWINIWNNINNITLPTRVSAIWYDVVNETIPTAQRLHKINLRPTAHCDKCHLVETLPHIILCGNKIRIWNWTRKKLAVINRTNENYIEVTEVLKPDWKRYPSAKNNSYAWFIGHFLFYVLTNTTPNLEDYTCYLAEEHFTLRKNKKYKTWFQNFLLVALRDLI